MGGTLMGTIFTHHYGRLLRFLEMLCDQVQPTGVYQVEHLSLEF